MASQTSAKKTKKKSPKGQAKPWRQLLLLLAFAALTTAVLAINILPKQVSYAEGDIAQEDIYYEKNTATYSSQLRTVEARQQAVDAVEPVYEIDPGVLVELLESVQDVFARVDEVRVRNVTGDAEDEDAAVTDKLSELREILPGTYSDELLQYILAANTREFTSLRQSLENALTAVYEAGVNQGEQVEAKEAVSALLESSVQSEQGREFLYYYLAGISLPYNEDVDYVKTVLAQDEAREAVDMVQVTVQRGERLISRGSVVTAEQIEALSMLGMLSENSSYMPYLGLLVIVLALYALLAFYLSYYQPKVFLEGRRLLLLCVIMLLILAVCKLLALIGTASGETGFLTQIGYLLPVSTASMLVAVLLGRNLAVFVTVLISMLVGIIMDGNLAYALVALGGGTAGIISTAHLNQRSQFVGASVYILLANLLLAGAWGLLYNQSYVEIGVAVLLGIVNGFFSAILAMGLLPFLETAFSVTTEVRLLELSNSNHPLLKRLMVEAPGTYNHSVLVGNLAEAAADAIGADPLMVRVAAYYHDLGKLKRPYFFVENQNGGDNPHDKLQPALSYTIITSHVRDGVEMLRAEKFPEEIIDIVEQHHGTTTLQYFFRKAQDQALDKDAIKEEDFRYPYRKPQTKEAALLHLADSVQAAVQSLKNPVKGQIEEMIQNIIKGKMEDGQLEECPLTFQDVNRITQSFMTVLSGVNHSRIVYPDQVVKEVGGTLNARMLEYAKAGLAAAPDGAGAAAGALAAGGGDHAGTGEPLDAAGTGRDLPDDRG